MNFINKIIIIGANHHNTYSMVRCYGEAGFTVTVYIYGDDSSFISYSRYVEAIKYYATSHDAVVSIIADYEITSHKPLVIACSDEISSLMDQHYDNLDGKCYFFNAGEEGRITQYMDKQKQLKLAAECGFSVPSSLDISPNAIIHNSISYPCIIKPTASIFGGKNISICYTADELRDSLKTYPSHYNVLVQELIQRDYEIVILGLSYADKIIIPGYVRKYRDYKGGTTYSAVNPIYELPHNLIVACEKLITEIQYNGLWGIECIKSSDNYYFLELNLRNDATTYSMKVAGANLPLLYLQLIDTSYDKNYKLNVRKINSIVEFNDFNFVLRGKVSIFKWLSQYREAECKYFYSSIDPMPYKQKKKQYLLFLFRRLLGL